MTGTIIEIRKKLMENKLILTLSPPWRNFLTSMVGHVVFPLLPLVLEWIFSDKISNTSLTLMAAFYAFSITLTSLSHLQFMIGVLICAFFSSIFGAIPLLNHGIIFLSSTKIMFLSITTIAVIFIWHAIERYNRHVILLEPFWDWFDNKKSENN
jgi:hypothetical protein